MDGVADARLAEELQQLTERYQKLTVLFGLGDISPSTFRMLGDRLLEERARLERALLCGEEE